MGLPIVQANLHIFSLSFLQVQTPQSVNPSLVSKTPIYSLGTCAIDGPQVRQILFQFLMVCRREWVVHHGEPVAYTPVIFLPCRMNTNLRRDEGDVCQGEVAATVQQLA